MALKTFARAFLFIYMTLVVFSSVFRVMDLVFYERSKWDIQDVVSDILAVVTSSVIIIASATIAFFYVILTSLWRRILSGELLTRKKPETFEQVFMNAFLNTYLILFFSSCCLLNNGVGQAQFRIEEAVRLLIILFISPFNLILLIVSSIISIVWASAWHVANRRRVPKEEDSKAHSDQQEDEHKQTE